MSKFRTNIFFDSKYFWFSVVRVVKVDYFDFPCEIFKILCKIDVRVIACNF